MQELEETGKYKEFIIGQALIVVKATVLVHLEKLL